MKPGYYFFILFILPLHLWFSLSQPTSGYAQGTPEKPSYITLISLVRGKHRWIDSQTDWLQIQADEINKQGFNGTWLLDYDALIDSDIIQKTQDFPKNQDLGLFLEVTPQLATKLGLPYDYLSPPHKPHNTFLSGYSSLQKQQIIDHLVKTYQNNYHQLPKSAGAWFIDSWSINYLNDTYGINNLLLVAEQYGTDHHTIRGHPWQIPYMPSDINALLPTTTPNQNKPVVVQWAVREPLRGYGYYREFSNFSVQANDYTQQGLDLIYFEKLLNTYTTENTNLHRQLTLGIEVGQEGAEYQNEFFQLLELVAATPNIKVVSLSTFGSLYRNQRWFEDQISFADWYDEVNSSWAGWITTKTYRIGLIADQESLTLRDLRVYSKDQDDSWMIIDKRHDLFRQVQPLIDQVGLDNSWTILKSPQLTVEAPSITQTENYLDVKFDGIQLEFTPTQLITNFPLKEFPDGVSEHKENNLFTYSFSPRKTSPSVNYFYSWLILIFIITNILGIALKLPQVPSLALFITTGLGLMLYEVWVLTPLNDLGLHYLFSLGQIYSKTALVFYGATPLIIVLGLLLCIKWIFLKTNNITFSLILSMSLLLGTSLTWVWPLYRKLPLDSTLIAGRFPNMITFGLTKPSLSLEKLSYAFSAGQLHITSLHQLTNSWGPNLILPILFFLLINFGVLFLGTGYLGYQLLKQKRWPYLGLYIFVIILVPLIVNPIDMRFPTILDWLLKSMGIVGVVLFVQQKKQDSPHLLLRLSIVILLSITPPTYTLFKRDLTLSYRSSMKWSDREQIVYELQNVQGELGDIFTQQLSAQKYLFIPRGIVDSYFYDIEILKGSYQITYENSYGFWLEKKL